MDGPFSTAIGLIMAADAALMQIIGLSLRVTLTAVMVACTIGLPLGAALARPKPAKTPVSRLTRPSHNSVGTARRRLAPRLCNC